MRWQCGITTVPERQESLCQSLRSIQAAGFPTPRIFADGCTRYHVPSSVDAITRHYPRIFTLGNWILGLYELYLRDPSADRYAMFQDDVELCRNIRQFLEASTKRLQHGYLNLYSFPWTEDVARREGKTGWINVATLADKSPAVLGKGAQALVFDRAGVVALLCSPHMVMRIQNRDKPAGEIMERGQSNIDGAINTAMRNAGYAEWIHLPGLVQHVGRESVMGSRMLHSSGTYPGPDFDAMELLKGV